MPALIAGIGIFSGITAQIELFPEVLQKEFLQNSVADYLVAVTTFLIGLLLVRIFEGIAIARLSRWSALTNSTLDDTLTAFCEKSAVPILYGGIVYLSLKGLNLHPTLERLLNVFGVLLLSFLAIRISTILVEHALRYYWFKKQNEHIKEEGLSLLLPSVRVAIWIVGTIFFLDNLGLNLSAVVASLGIGGVAIALASKNILEDLFSYYSILLDRPFEIGDVIVVGDQMGTVENVGIKTTRIRSISGEQLIFSNSSLVSSRIKNYKRMERRRIVFSVSVSYDTSLEQLREIPAIAKNIIESIQKTSFDRAHFSSYGESSLNFEIVYYVLSKDYTLYMDIQQQINLRLNEEFRKQAINFAHPTAI